MIPAERTVVHAVRYGGSAASEGSAVMATYSGLPTKLVSAANGVDYAYRDTGEGPEPLVLLQHFGGNLDNWDPALIDTLASTRRVVTFDNAGVGGSTGTTPDSIEQMARDAIAFLTAMGFGRADILGFSIGSFVAQEIALIRPDLVRGPDPAGHGEDLPRIRARVPVPASRRIRRRRRGIPGQTGLA